MVLLTTAFGGVYDEKVTIPAVKSFGLVGWRVGFVLWDALADNQPASKWANNTPQWVDVHHQQPNTAE